MYATILDNTKGIIFMGTPHQGTLNIAWLAAFTSKVMASLRLKEPPPAPHELKLWSSELLDYAHNFVEIRNKFPIWSFYETEKTHGVKVRKTLLAENRRTDW